MRHNLVCWHNLEFIIMDRYILRYEEESGPFLLLGKQWQRHRLGVRMNIHKHGQLFQCAYFASGTRPATESVHKLQSRNLWPANFVVYPFSTVPTRSTREPWKKKKHLSCIKLVENTILFSSLSFCIIFLLHTWTASMCLLARGPHESPEAPLRKGTRKGWVTYLP